ncbi:hypothetical protein J6590_078844 [Homalodisca vitripennis]|nr:hypothetical protein J6590_078844 [Homalodisca vitripennis]
MSLSWQILQLSHARVSASSDVLVVSKQTADSSIVTASETQQKCGLFLRNNDNQVFVPTNSTGACALPLLPSNIQLTVVLGLTPLVHEIR